MIKHGMAGMAECVLKVGLTPDYIKKDLSSKYIWGHWMLHTANLKLELFCLSQKNICITIVYVRLVTCVL